MRELVSSSKINENSLKLSADRKLPSSKSASDFDPSLPTATNARGGKTQAENLHPSGRRLRSATVAHSKPSSENRFTSRSEYEKRFFALMKGKSQDMPAVTSEIPFKSENITIKDSSSLGQLGLTENNRVSKSDDISGSLGMLKLTRDKYLGFLKSTKSRSRRPRDYSTEFMRGQNEVSQHRLSLEQQPQFDVPDPILLLEKVGNGLQGCHWKSPVISDEFFLMEILFNGQYDHALEVIQRMSGLQIDASSDNVEVPSVSDSSISSISSSISWYSAHETIKSNYSRESNSLSFGAHQGFDEYEEIAEVKETMSPLKDSKIEINVLTASSSSIRSKLALPPTGSMYISKEGLEPKDLSAESLPRLAIHAAPRMPKKIVHQIDPKAKSNAKILHKFNSCTTIFTIDSTVYKPSSNPAYLEITLKSFAHAIHTHLTRTHTIYKELLTFDNISPSTMRSLVAKTFKSSDILSEKLHMIWRTRNIPNSVLDSPEIMHPPKLEEIYQFLRHIFVSADLTAEIAIIALIYLERLMLATKIGMFGLNCFRMILGSLILASKIWDDQAVWNVDFKTIVADLELDSLNDLERWWLRKIKFDVGIKRAVFAKYWFEIREVADHVWGVKLDRNKVVKHPVRSVTSTGITKTVSMQSPEERTRAVLFAPAFRSQQEAQGRKTDSGLAGTIPRPLTEAHIDTLAASTSYSQTKLRATFSQTLAYQKEGGTINDRSKSGESWKSALVDADIGKDAATNRNSTQGEVSFVDVEHFEWGASNLRRSKSENFYTPSAPPASVM